MTVDLSAACACTEADIRTLSDAELIALADVVSGVTGDALVKQGQREAGIERQLAGDLERDFRETLNPALEDAIGTLPQTDIDAGDVNTALRSVSDRVAARDTSRTEAMLGGALAAWLLLARRATRTAIHRLRAGGRPGGGRPGAVISASLTQADREALDALSRQQLFWIGDFWSSHLSRRIAATVSREALQIGLGRQQVGQILRGVIDGTFRSVSVPATFSGSTDQYFSMLAGTVRNRASNFGAIHAMSEAEVQTYRISAVMDRRTSDICSFLNGRTFSVSTGLRHIERTLAAGDPDAVKRAAAWRSIGEVRTIAGSGDAGSQSQALAAAGLSLPPYHGRCRTQVTV